MIILFINNIFENNYDKRNTWIEYPVSKIRDETMYGRFFGWNSKFYCLIFVVRRSKNHVVGPHIMFSRLKQRLHLSQRKTSPKISKNTSKNMTVYKLHLFTESLKSWPTCCFFDMTRFVFVTPVSINHWTRKSNNF